jgi:hypothetical protein
MEDCNRYRVKIYDSISDDLIAVVRFTYHDIDDDQLTNWASRNGYAADDLYTEEEIVTENACQKYNGHHIGFVREV